PSLAEDSGTITPVTGITVTPATVSVEAGKTVELTVAVQPDTASDKTFRVSSDHNNVATVTVKDNVITVKGVAKGTALIPVMSNGGAFAAVATVTVTTPAAQPAT
ncbi:TPA: Ig domain-containing protein, partial [Escherichia coli]|nr:Ig domain-containing protein [Escherichia coli]